MLEELFWTVEGLRGRIDVSIVTLRRWKRTHKVPKWAYVLIRLLTGELDAIDPAFAGWIIRDGELVTPEGWRFTPGQIRSIPFLYGQVRLWRQEALTYRETPRQQPLPLEAPREERAYPNALLQGRSGMRSPA